MDNDARARWIIWASMMTSQLLFGAVAATLRPEVDGDVTMWAPIAAAAVGPGALSVLWGRAIGPGGTQATWIVRWALGEAVGLFGFVALWLGAPVAVGAGLLTAGIVLVAAQPPR